MVAVTTLSTVAMIAYPIVFSMLGYTDLQAGFLIGATIHDVAQVVGAGYSVSREAGDTAVMADMAGEAVQTMRTGETQSLAGVAGKADVQSVVEALAAAETVSPEAVQYLNRLSDFLFVAARAAKVPIIADIHFHYKRALEAADAGAACLRINPGNIGSPERVKEVVRAAKANGCSIRIGVNGGSLEKHLLEKYGEPCPEALVESAFEHAKLLEDADFHAFKISVKASDVFMAVAAYNELAARSDYPLHLGITEAGGLIGGTVKSSIGLGMLLWGGVGDTIRVSLSAEPEEEVKVGYHILKSLGIRARGVKIVSCPSCARPASARSRWGG